MKGPFWPGSEPPLRSWVWVLWSPVSVCVLRQLGVEASRTAPVAPGFSTAIGVGLILGGLLACILGTIRFLRARRQIELGQFEPEAFAELAVIGITMLAGAALVIYLVLTA